MKSITNCNQVREYLLDLAEEQDAAPVAVRQHVSSCSACARELQSLKATMNMLDEWKSPEPSPYFDSRLQARLREERARAAAQPSGVLAWFGVRWQQAAAFALAAVMAVGIGWYQLNRNDATPPSAHTTAVADLQELDQNADLLANFEVLDDGVDQN